MAKTIAVIGSEGFVGSAFCRMVEGFYNVERCDPALGMLETATQEEVNKCVLGVVCVPTPMAADGSCNTTTVETVLGWLDTPVILIKSTVTPGTTQRLKEETGKRIVMSPEQIRVGRSYLPPDKDFQEVKDEPMVVLGGDEEDCNYIIDLLLPVLGSEKDYYVVSSTEAELIKYTSNYYAALKITWANEMYEICKMAGVNWYKVWQGWGLDPRVDTMYTAVFPEERGYGGACLPKDAEALHRWASCCGFVPPLLGAMIDENKWFREMNKGENNDTNS